MNRCAFSILEWGRSRVQWPSLTSFNQHWCVAIRSSSKEYYRSGPFHFYWFNNSHFSIQIISVFSNSPTATLTCSEHSVRADCFLMLIRRGPSDTGAIQATIAHVFQVRHQIKELVAVCRAWGQWTISNLCCNSYTFRWASPFPTFL